MLRKEKIKMILMCVLTSIMLILLGGCMNPTTGNERSNIDDVAVSNFVCEVNCGCDEQVYDPDFSGNKIIVTMDREIGGINKVHDLSFFGDNRITEIIDLFPVSEEAMAWTNVETFQQILLLILSHDCKKGVLEISENLKRIDGVESASPNYFVPIEEFEMVGVE